MVRILCNHALDGFDHRARFATAGIELVTFGLDKRAPKAEHFGENLDFDIEFDTSCESWHELHARLPKGFTPDFVLFYWPEQEPIPADLEQCPFPVVGVMSDYNIALQFTTGLAPFFDVLLCDHGGLEIYRKIGFADVRHYVQFSHKTRIHRTYDDVPTRDVDILFGGNVNPLVQHERNRFLRRIDKLRGEGIRGQFLTGIFGEEYGRSIASAKLGFNRSVRGEMNLRGFEVPACGAVLLMEADNREVRDFFVPDEECVLYEDDQLEDTIRGLLADPGRQNRIARAGLERVREHRMPERILAMVKALEGIKIRRPEFRVSSASLAMGRARAMMQTWAEPKAGLRALTDAHNLAPEDPRPLNDLAVGLVRFTTRLESFNCFRAIELCQQAMHADPDYVIAAVNVWNLLTHFCDDTNAIERMRAEVISRAERATTLRNFDGILIKTDFKSAMSSHCNATNLAHCAALHEAILTDSVAPLRALYTGQTSLQPA